MSNDVFTMYDKMLGELSGQCDKVLADLSGQVNAGQDAASLVILRTRVAALDAALRWRGAELASPECIVETAQIFGDFLAGAKA